MIRELTAEDAQKYWDLRLEALINNGEAFAVTYEESTSRSNPVERVRNNLVSSGSTTLGAFIDGKLAGNVTILFNSLEKMKHKGSIVAMYVSPSSRKLGIGSALLSEAEKTAKQSGVERLQLTVVTSNSSAIKLYERAGYSSYGVEKHAMKANGEYLDEMWMSKELL
ncbi:GNAT family N-acetyltransferase [Rossellomorea vietnamensis]|uniref:GNAT family N-acetyltransferase n=1 Tax=Rossellomorea vietnamensis TaxID=218284 RepID=A0A5D4MJ05_9BACI|nr:MULTISPECIES: GNAT family N-acetyltransferase [Bacillaceae]TYS01703.1 GNAT family N-acetyltransferase [Rossellomorea vietnamensis]